MQPLTAPTTRILETIFSASHGPVLDLLGPTVEFITSPDGPEDFCVLKGTIPPGVAVPLHSHDDPEAFFVVSGPQQALIQGGPRKPPNAEDLARLSEPKPNTATGTPPPSRTPPSGSNCQAPAGSGMSCTSAPSPPAPPEAD
jgi:hypothetical protein